MLLYMYLQVSSYRFKFHFTSPLSILSNLAYHCLYLLRASCLKLECRCYVAKIEESEKAGSRQESNPGHLWLEPPHIITSKFIFSNLLWALEWENHSPWVLSWWREFSDQPLTEFWWHILRGCQVWDWGIQYHLCSAYRGLWGFGLGISIRLLHVLTVCQSLPGPGMI